MQTRPALMGSPAGFQSAIGQIISTARVLTCGILGLLVGTATQPASGT